MIIHDINDLYDILESEALDNARMKNMAFSVYNYEGSPVPRVTKVIDDVMNREYLIKWAMSFKNYNIYLGEKDFITSIGTHVHELIEHLLMTGTDKDISYKRMPKQSPLIERAYENFKLWYNTLFNGRNEHSYGQGRGPDRGLALHSGLPRLRRACQDRRLRHGDRAQS